MLVVGPVADPFAIVALQAYECVGVQVRVEDKLTCGFTESQMAFGMVF